MTTTYTPEQIQAAAESLGFQTADLMLSHFTATQMEDGLYEKLREADQTRVPEMKFLAPNLLVIEQPDGDYSRFATLDCAETKDREIARRMVELWNAQKA